MSGALTGFETVAWRVGSASGLRPDFTNVIVLSRVPDREALRARVCAMVDSLPRMRQCVSSRPWGIAPPAWRDDAHFELDEHYLRVACPAPGTTRQLLDLAEALTAPPLDPGRPLWRLTLVEGMEGGRAALVQQVHHAVTDGAGGVRLLGALFHPPEAGGREAGVERPEERPGGSAIFGALARAAGAAGEYRSAGVGAAAALDFARRQLLVGKPPCSALLSSRSASRRRFFAHSLPFERVRRAARALGGSRNDLFVCGVAGALGTYHDRMGRPCDELRMGVPLLRRSGRRQVGGNDVTVVTVRVPTGPKDPVERFRLVRERLAELAAEPALPLADVTFELLAAVPAPLLVALAAAELRAVDFATSSVPGLFGTGDLAGARVEASYPFGPRMGCALNVTSLRCAGALNVGINLDPAALTDSDAFLDCLVEAFEDLLRVALPREPAAAAARPESA